MELPDGHTPSLFEKLFSRAALQGHVGYKALLGLAVVALLASMFPHAESLEFSYAVGSVWADNDLTAPFSFPINKETRTYEQERQVALRAVYPVFARHDEIARVQTEVARSVGQDLILASEARARSAKSGRYEDSVLFRQLSARLSFSLTGAEWDLLQPSPGKIGDVRTLARALPPLVGQITDLYRSGILDENKAKLQRTHFAERKGSIEELAPLEQAYDAEEASAFIASRLVTAFGTTAVTSVAGVISRALMKPNLLFDRQATATALEIAADNVPRTLGYVRENERIILKNERITEEHKLKLDSFLKAKAERGSALNEWKHRLGILLHVVIVLGLFGIYLYLFRKRIFRDNRRLLLIALIFLMEGILAYLSLQLDVTLPVQYLIFVPAASMLLTIIFDSRVAFYGTVTTALLVAAIRGNDYTIALTSLVAGALGAYTVRDVGNRRQIFSSMIYVFFGYAVTMTAFSLEQFDGFRTIFVMLGFAAANAVFSPVLTYGLLILFERAFGVTTDLTLAELTDVNHPLLQQLSEKAPGTFHHSITIGSLAEAAAEDIGANAILSKVGGYYHDIGKMLKPEYFVENQVGSHSRHGRLRPRMSALIIQSHVKEGMELAREHGLPESVVEFIPQHHGTTRISFFFDKALKQAAKRPQKESINEADFRYPGPRPQTKETAIVMLADSVESSTRAITDITPQRLEQSIDNMIKHRFVEGQLDECELTLRDLTKIKDAFLKILMGIHHHRITYPEQQPAETVMVTQPVEQGVEQPLPEEADGTAPVPEPPPAEVRPALPEAAIAPSAPTAEPDPGP